MLASSKLRALPQLGLFLLLSISKTGGSLFENETCRDGDCNSTSTVVPVQSSTTKEVGSLELSTSSVIESTTEVTTVSTEGTSTGVTAASDLFTTTRDARDFSVTSSNKYLTPTKPVPTADFPVLSKRIKLFNRSHPFGDHCPCDLLVGSCDPNCCCDVLDCSEEEKEAFSKCLPLPSPVPDPRLCHQYKWVTTPNHTVELHNIDNHQHGLLCINQDNNPSRLALADHIPARSVKEFQDLIENKELFKWSTPMPYSSHFDANSSYKAGDALWTVQESSLFPLEMTTSGFNNLCQSKKLVRFLEDWKSSCVLPLPFVEDGEKEPRNSIHSAVLKEKCLELGAGSSLRNTTILSSPLHWLNTTSHTCPPEVCIRAQQWLCHSPNFDDCIEAEDVPSALLEGSKCINALTAVRFVMDVLGVNIHSAQAYFVLSNVSFSGEAPAISRRHSVIFKWWSSEEDIGAEYDKDRIVWRRSGSPGYITGEPIMAGWKETVVLGGEDLKHREDGLEGGGVLEAIRVTPHPEGWLTMLGPVAGTRTCGGPRRTVRFGHSARWSCSIPVLSADATADGCTALKKKTLALLLGWEAMGNLSERFIAMFGDSAPERLVEWLPLKIVSHNGKELSEVTDERWGEGQGDSRGKPCSGLHTSVHLEIVTALVGSVNNPQAKVLGAILRMGPTLDLEPHKLWPIRRRGTVAGAPANVTTGGVVETTEGETGKKLHLILVSSVKFMDITGPPIMEVAPPPVYHIRLPHNFFHPFLSSAAPFHHLHARQLMVLILPVIVHSRNGAWHMLC